jgi:hypothetical protein
MAAGTSRWYWVHKGRAAGPVTWDELLGLGRSGKLKPKDPVLRVGSQTWQLAESARDDDDELEAAAMQQAAPGGASATAVMPPAAPPPMIQNVSWPSMGTAIDAEDDAEDAAVDRAVNRGRLVWGLLLSGGGLLGTIAGYNAAVARGGGRYIIFTGPIIWGLSLILRSFGRSRERE